MPADRLLNTVLRAYLDAPNPSQTDKILGTTNTLLTSLTNPLNLSLLTSHFLTARSIWQQPDGLRTCLRIISIYNTAAIHVRRNELDNAALPKGQLPMGSGVRAEEWARAVAKGLDERSNRWQHTLVLAGILMGMEGDNRRSLSRGLRSALEQAVATAANMALEDASGTGPLGRGAVVLALTYAFPLLGNGSKGLLNGNALLPAVVEAMLGAEGFQHGDFIHAIQSDLAPARSLSWSVSSPSVDRIQKLESRPLAQNMGPLSRLGAFAVEHAQDSNAILRAHDQILAFTGGLLHKWENCALSTIDPSVEIVKLPPEVRQGPWPMLWQLLKKILFAVVATLHPMVGRCLLDPNLWNPAVAPTFAAKTLHILRHLSFISFRDGGNTLQVYNFTYLTSLDILARYSDACSRLLEETIPPQTSTVPTPVRQALSLFYLNTAEHLPLSLPTPAAEALVVAPASANLSPTSSWVVSPANTPPSSLTLQLFESSHAALLSVFSCPQHSAVTASLIPFYIDTLLLSSSSFPSRISSRQFRLAFRTVVQISSPPFPISATHPDLSETLLEMLRHRAEDASTAPLPPDPNSSDSSSSSSSPDSAAAGPGGVPISEQTALVLALIDSLPYLPTHALQEWLSRAAEACAAIPDPRMRDVARRRLWEVLASGELDVDRAVAGVAWWGLRGGRAMIAPDSGHPGAETSNTGEGEFMMSGALAEGDGGKGPSCRL
ncbi:peroxin 8 [Xylariaceae sp. FL0594]|nr:peroxin 8 [Xylariaceae sp. FL0594]